MRRLTVMALVALALSACATKPEGYYPSHPDRPPTRSECIHAAFTLHSWVLDGLKIPTNGTAEDDAYWRLVHQAYDICDHIPPTATGEA